MEGNFFAKKFPSTPPFKKLLNGADRSCAATENRGAAKVTRTGKGILIVKKLRFFPNWERTFKKPLRQTERLW